MHVYFAARQVEPGSRAREYAVQHLVEPIKRHTGLNITRAEVQLFVDGDPGRPLGCHVLIDLKGGRQINIRECDTTFYAAIDVAKDRTLRALAQLKSRLTASRRHPRPSRIPEAAQALGLGPRPT